MVSFIFGENLYAQKSFETKEKIPTIEEFNKFTETVAHFSVYEDNWVVLNVMTLKLPITPKGK